MEENRRRRTPKKPEHPVREWISDNLRYFMLIGGILLILLLSFLVVKLLSSVIGGSSKTGAETAVSEAADYDHMSDMAESSSVEEEDEGNPSETPDAAAEDTEKQDVGMTKEAEGSVLVNLIQTYFDGLAAKNPEQVQSCVDVFTEEDYNQVVSNTQITAYKDITVYTCDGPDDASRIAFVSYSYTMADSDAEIPALTEFYIYQPAGEWKLAANISDEGIQERIRLLAETDEVQDMIRTVQEKYDELMKAHPELAG